MSCNLNIYFIYLYRNYLKIKQKYMTYKVIDHIITDERYSVYKYMYKSRTLHCITGSVHGICLK